MCVCVCVCVCVSLCLCFSGSGKEKSMRGKNTSLVSCLFGFFFYSPNLNFSRSWRVVFRIPGIPILAYPLVRLFPIEKGVNKARIPFRTDVLYALENILFNSSQSKFTKKVALKREMRTDFKTHSADFISVSDQEQY
jgi:hypothetical protein